MIRVGRDATAPRESSNNRSIYQGIYHTALAHLCCRKVSCTYLPERFREVYEPLLKLAFFTSIARVKAATITSFFLELCVRLMMGFDSAFRAAYEQKSANKLDC